MAILNISIIQLCSPGSSAGPAGDRDPAGMGLGRKSGSRSCNRSAVASQKFLFFPGSCSSSCSCPTSSAQKVPFKPFLLMQRGSSAGTEMGLHYAVKNSFYLMAPPSQGKHSQALGRAFLPSPPSSALPLLPSSSSLLPDCLF